MLSATRVSKNSSGTGVASVLAWNSRHEGFVEWIGELGDDRPQLVDEFGRHFRHGADQNHPRDQVGSPFGESLGDEGAE